MDDIIINADNGTLPAFRVSGQTENLDRVCFNPETVLGILKRLNRKSTYGPDGIPNIVYRELAEQICHPLSIIFEYSFKSNGIPTLWSHSNITNISNAKEFSNALI